MAGDGDDEPLGNALPTTPLDLNAIEVGVLLAGVTRGLALPAEDPTVRRVYEKLRAAAHRLVTM
jgi:hypothetical protein